MALFEEIRREYEFGAGTVAGVARTFRVHRRLVREAIGSAVPAQRVAAPRARPKLGPVVAFIDAILEADRRAPRKQRHTAHRIWRRIQAEHPTASVAESSVRQYVRERKQALGLLQRGTFVPQQYAWGEEGQADWYEAQAVVDGVERTWQVFTLRSMASGAAFHRAYERATQQAFLDAHQAAFASFGGVFHRIRYDNLSSAVRKVLTGHRREETARFIAFRSHWRFAAAYCTPGEGHEKGGVENEVGTFRRNHWVPLPVAPDLDDLNAQLLAACRADEARVLVGRADAVGVALRREQSHLLPLATEPFDLAEASPAVVTTLGTVRVRTNSYSVPLAAGTSVEVRVLPSVVEVRHAGRRVATHPRSYGRFRDVLDLEHYLDVLEHKPGAFAGSKPLDQARRAGRWPASYDQLWQVLMARQGQQPGTKAMIALLQLGRQHGADRLRAAIEQALARGCPDAAAAHGWDQLVGLAPDVYVPEAVARALPGGRAAHDATVVWLRVVVGPWPFPPGRAVAPAALVALGLLDQATPLAQSRGREVLSALHRLAPETIVRRDLRARRRAVLATARESRPGAPWATTPPDDPRDPLLDDEAAAAHVMAVLHAAGAGKLTRAALAAALGVPPERIDVAYGYLKGHPPLGLQVQRHGDTLRLVTAGACARSVERHRGAVPPQPLTAAQLEVLAIVAYQQPVSRATIDEIRLVNSDGPVAFLLQRGLIAEHRRRPNGAAQLVTTHACLSVLGIRGLEELPAPTA